MEKVYTVKEVREQVKAWRRGGRVPDRTLSFISGNRES